MTVRCLIYPVFFDQHPFNSLTISGLQQMDLILCFVYLPPFGAFSPLRPGLLSCSSPTLRTTPSDGRDPPRLFFPSPPFGVLSQFNLPGGFPLVFPLHIPPESFFTGPHNSADPLRASIVLSFFPSPPYLPFYLVIVYMSRAPPGALRFHFALSDPSL